MTLIDRKRSIYTSKKGIGQLRRQSEAIAQNPDYKAIIEVPNEKQLRRLNRVLQKEKINNITGRVVNE